MSNRKSKLDELFDAQLLLLPRTHAEALRIGATRFFTGKPCSRGHITQRHTASNTCDQCYKDDSAHRRRAKGQKTRAELLELSASSPRNEAKRRGLKTYFTGLPCSRGHVAERSVANWGCLTCQKENNQRHDRKRRKAPRYFTGEPCVRGHIAERYSSNDTCVECAKIAKRNRAAKIAKPKIPKGDTSRKTLNILWGENGTLRTQTIKRRLSPKSRQRRREKARKVIIWRIVRSAWTKRRPFQTNIAWTATHNAYRRLIRQKNQATPNGIERRKKDKRAWKARRSRDVLFRLRQSISASILGTLQKRKNGRRAFDLIGYSPSALRAHLESLFLDGMSWENYGPEWHIDHRRPVASFVFGDDWKTTIKECWALDNLQPMWGRDNSRKGARWNGVIWSNGKAKQQELSNA